jgi:hypothetical protein
LKDDRFDQVVVHSYWMRELYALVHKFIPDTTFNLPEEKWIDQLKIIIAELEVLV